MPKKLENEVKKEKTKKKIAPKGKATSTKKNAIVTKSMNHNTNVTKKTSSKKVEKNVASNNKKVSATKVNKGKNDTKKNHKEMKEENLVEELNTNKQEFLQEYYDLPYRYNETIVTILAQTPKRLFVYWDISDKDREKYRKAFGDDFFEKTYPVLLVHNEELNYTFEVPINDFANSWYLDIQDSKTNYVVQLGRKFKNVEQTKTANFEVVKEEHINLQNDFIYITDSNKLEAPNDHMLFELLSSKVTYRNVKDGSESTKDLKDLVNDFNRVYPAEVVHELYTKLYSNEIMQEDFGRKNPASSEIGLPTSSGSLRSSGAW